MSREAYQVPSLGAQNAFGTEGMAAGSMDGPVVAYLCGECNARVSLKRGDQIRCKDCGHRVLYKERTKRRVFLLLREVKICPCTVANYSILNRMVQFEAR
jgi:DNA-directed RNA polymerase I, II, and III subunit RPABC4